MNDWQTNCGQNGQLHREMSETEGLAKVRVANRGSMTRIIRQVYKNLESRDGANLLRLRQHHLSLTEKLRVVKIDDELLEIVNEEELTQK